MKYWTFCLLFCGFIYSCSTLKNGRNAGTNSKSFVILQSGQSNAWGASGPTGFDTAANPRVLVWQHAQTQPGWQAHLNQRPFRTKGYNSLDGTGQRDDLNASGNEAFYLAKKIAAAYPADTIKIILAIGDGQSINQWYENSKTGKYIDSINSRCIASGVKKIDLFLWDQGESDSYMPEHTYLQSFDSIKAYLRAQPYFPANTPIIAVGLGKVAFGASKGFLGKDTTLMKLQHNADKWDTYVSADSIHIANDSVHFSGGGLDTIAMRAFEAWEKMKVY